ncbi:hypothetical protein OL229_04405 [Neisseriaceae bacterium JH1-16]|nr:hypothetical protein [Neisseriaceae bacterium JH1-16]
MQESDEKRRNLEQVCAVFVTGMRSDWERLNVSFAKVIVVSCFLVGLAWLLGYSRGSWLECSIQQSFQV